MFKVSIIGGKGTNNYEAFRNKCIYFLQNKASEGILIYSTGDDFVDIFAHRYGIGVQYFYSDFKSYKNNALKKRNEKMLQDCDALIMFDDGLKDTKYIYQMAMEKHIPCRSVTL